jgi:hypothetical protein
MKLEDFRALDCVIYFIIRRPERERVKGENRECFYKQSNWYGLATILTIARICGHP